MFFDTENGSGGGGGSIVEGVTDFNVTGNTSYTIPWNRKPKKFLVYTISGTDGGFMFYDPEIMDATKYFGGTTTTSAHPDFYAIGWPGGTHYHTINSITESGVTIKTGSSSRLVGVPLHYIFIY